MGNDDNGSVMMESGKKEIRKGPKVVARTILALFAVTALVGGSWWLVESLAYVGTDDAAIDGQQIKLGSKTLGRIASVDVVEGQKVVAGDVLVRLDAADLEAQRKQSDSSLAYARQNLSLARVSLDKAKSDAARSARLYSSGAATRESDEHAQSALKAAEAQFALATAQIATSEAQLGVIAAQLANTEIKTPIPGTVDHVTLVAGDVAQPGQTIVSVNNLADVWVIANLEETKIGRVRQGARVAVTVDAYGRKPFEGRVSMIRAGIVPPSFQIGEFTKTTQRVPVKITLENVPEGAILLPGMSCEVKIRTASWVPFIRE